MEFFVNSRALVSCIHPQAAASEKKWWWQPGGGNCQFQGLAPTPMGPPPCSQAPAEQRRLLWVCQSIVGAEQLPLSHQPSKLPMMHFFSATATFKKFINPPPTVGSHLLTFNSGSLTGILSSVKKCEKNCFCYQNSKFSEIGIMSIMWYFKVLRLGNISWLWTSHIWRFK